MAFSNLSRWLWRRRDPKSRPTASPVSTERRRQEPEIAAASGRRSRKSGVGVGVGGGVGVGVGVGGDCKPATDPEFNGVMVPANGVCMSDSDDSGDSDWSIGWFEPQSSEFSSETESEKSFAVLVPCYGVRALSVKDPRKKKGSSKGNDPRAQLLNAVLSTSPSQDSQKYLREWLDSLKS